MKIRKALRQCQSLLAFGCAAVAVLLAASGAQAQTTPPPTTCERTVKADVVALDQASISNVHAQCDRTGAFARTQLNVAGNETLCGVNRDDIALQRIDHTCGVDGAETVVN